MDDEEDDGCHDCKQSYKYDDNLFHFGVQLVIMSYFFIILYSKKNCLYISATFEQGEQLFAEASRIVKQHKPPRGNDG